MKEILIAAGVLIGILALALTIGYFKGSGVSEKEKEHQAQVQILERNVKSATDELKKAVDIGASYCIGKEPGETKDVAAKLLAPFKGNAKIYNVFFNKDFKDKKQTEKHEQVALVDDQEHRTLDELNKLMPEEKESKDMKDVSVKYALAREGDKRIPVIIAKKVIRAAKEELVNMGGQITVIVRAEEDNFFHAALQKTFEDPKTETKPAGTEAKK